MAWSTGQTQRSREAREFVCVEQQTKNSADVVRAVHFVVFASVLSPGGPSHTVAKTRQIIHTNQHHVVQLFSFSFLLTLSLCSFSLHFLSLPQLSFLSFFFFFLLLPTLLPLLPLIIDHGQEGKDGKGPVCHHPCVCACVRVCVCVCVWLVSALTLTFYFPWPATFIQHNSRDKFYHLAKESGESQNRLIGTWA